MPSDPVRSVINNTEQLSATHWAVWQNQRHWNISVAFCAVALSKQSLMY